MGVMMRCLVIFALLGIGSQTAAQDITATLFEAASENMIVLWTSYPGASSYKVSVARQSMPSSTVSFAIFSPYVVLGAVHSLHPNIAYVVTVEALDGSGQPIATSNALMASTAPSVMDPISVVKAQDSTTLIAEFAEVTGATGYIIRIETLDHTFFHEDEVASSPAQLGSLEPYTTYSLSIMSKNRDGRSQPSSPVEGKTLLPPPELTTSSPSNDSIIASWTNVTDAVLYTVAAHKFDSTVIENTTSLSETLSGLDAGSLYIVYVHAWDAEGRKGEAVETNQTTRPPTPSSVSATVVWNEDVAGLNVSWSLDQPVNGPVSYQVVDNTNLECNSTSSHCTLTPVVCGETYYIQVTASNEAGPSYPSPPLVFMTFPCPPVNLEVEETEPGNCTLSWNSTLYADKYKAFIKRDDGEEINCTTTDTSCDFTCLCGYTYLMDVFAYNQAGASPEGQTINITTLPCCPEDVSVSLVSTETLEIRWTPVRGAQLYETRAVHAAETIVCNDTAPVCALSDLTCDSSYSVRVIPCNEIRGCNRACRAHTRDTAPCMPDDLSVNQTGNSISVSWTPTNRAVNYTVLVEPQPYMGTPPITCTSASDSCSISDLPCGTEYQVSATARNSAGQSLPSFTVDLETGPCCPENLTVEQVTMAMSNVTWSHARGAQTFITSLTSTRGHARCHTQDSHCLMGCITCGTNYTVGMEAFSRTGHKSVCTYQGFSSSACCPSGIKLYRLSNNALRVYWRSSGSNYNYTVEMAGQANYTCTPPLGQTSCDITNVACGDIYHVTVAPVTPAGDTVHFCPQRMYSVTCAGSNVGMVIYRGKRSVN